MFFKWGETMAIKRRAVAVRPTEYALSRAERDELRSAGYTRATVVRIESLGRRSRILRAQDCVGNKVYGRWYDGETVADIQRWVGDVDFA